MNYTKGEWKIKTYTVMANGQVVADFTVPSCQPDMTREERIANAHLIAASPRTTESLRTILLAIPGHYTDAQAARHLGIGLEQLREAKKALASAEGREECCSQ